jgi:hypothetical protein
MKIEIANFKLVSIEDRFDVYEKRLVEQKEGPAIEREKLICNNMRFETAMEYVRNRNLNDMDITVSSAKYIEMYKKEREKMLNLLK